MVLDKILMILEVSRKQDYIFSSKKLKENAARSGDISYVTSNEFFARAASSVYNAAENMVYSGGGHTVLQFSDSRQATEFARRVTEAALREFDGLELFVKQLHYDPASTAGENLKRLSAALEEKKARRTASFRQMSFGLEMLDSETFRPVRCGEEPERQYAAIRPPENWEYPAEFEKLAGPKDNFIAVVHIDGNAMGKRVNNIYDDQAQDWEACCKRLRRFSQGIQADFERAFQETVEQVIRWQPEGMESDVLPIRPVILAGDDVCFVTAGRIGLECARIFLEKLSGMKNQEDGADYAACAGVALVHKKFPFHQAYDLAEELCSSAKRFGAGLDASGQISAMDWHIEFGQLKDSLADLREDYETEDGGQLELRPVTVVVPEGCATGAAVRSYDYFRSMVKAMKSEKGKTARGKIKQLRTAFKQGEVESLFFLRDKQIGGLLYHAFESEQGKQAFRTAYEILRDGGEIAHEAFCEVDGVRRCLFFDSIEMIDHCSFVEGVE